MINDDGTAITMTEEEAVANLLEAAAVMADGLCRGDEAGLRRGYAAWKLLGERAHRFLVESRGLQT